MANSVVFFDGVCNLCNCSVRMLMKLDKNKVLKYSSLQGQSAKSILKKQTIKDLNSIVFFYDGVELKKAQAILKILHLIGGFPKLISIFLSIFPLGILNTFYDCIAKFRYKLFGKTDLCRIPSSEEKALFLE